MDRSKATVIIKDPNTLKVSEHNMRKRNPFRNMDNLINSVKEIGVFYPIIIDEKEEIIAGQRRWKAACEAGEKEIICVKIPFNDVIDKKLMTFLENYYQEPTEDLDKKDTLKSMYDSGQSIKQISKRTGVWEDNVQHMLGITRLSELSDEAKKVLLEQKFKKAHELTKTVNELKKYDPDAIENSNEIIVSVRKAKLSDAEDLRKETKLRLPGEAIVSEAKFLGNAAEKPGNYDVIKIRYNVETMKRFVQSLKKTEGIGINVWFNKQMEEYIKQHP